MKRTKLFLAALSAIVPLGFLLYPIGYMSVTACVPEQQQQEVLVSRPTYTDLFSFPKFNIPEAKKPGTVNLTTVIIVPEYKDTYNQEYAGGAKVSAGGVMSKDMLKVFKSFAGSVGEDIEASLVAKGMTTKGPFVMSDVTYPDKKGADLTVMTNVIFDIQYTNQKYLRLDHFADGSYGKVYSGNMSVGVKVYYYMLEPLSEEKMWIKKLDLGVQDYNYEYAMGQESYISRYNTYSDGCGGSNSYPVYDWRDTNTMIYDSRVKIFSDILKNDYPQVMKTAWNYLDTSEMMNLKQKAQEIRERKRY